MAPVGPDPQLAVDVTPPETRPELTAFVLSGGAALGSVQVGMLLALQEHGIVPDLLVGTSVGAMNGGWLAAGWDRQSLLGLADLWRGLHRSDVFPTRPLVGLRGFLGRSSYLVPSSGLRRVLQDNLRLERLEDAVVPLHVIATDVLTGQDVRLSTGPAVEAVLASASIPAVFPPVLIDGRELVDGGLINNTPISHAIELGATRIWVLTTGYACSLTEPPRGALAVALHALALTVNQRLAVDVARYEHEVDLRVIPPLCPMQTSPSDFSNAAELIDRSYAQSAQWLSTHHDVQSQAALLHPHPHPMTIV
jgi:NTE family protein